MDSLNLTDVIIEEFWDLVPTLEVPLPFRKTFKRGDDLIYESPYFSLSDGHEGLWTYNVYFVDNISKLGKSACLTFSFMTKLKTN